MRRDQGICYVCGDRGADQVDHVVPVAQGGSHELDNLAAIHGQPCAAKKNAKEANTARWEYRQKRDPEPHPGYIR